MEYVFNGKENLSISHVVFSALWQSAPWLARDLFVAWDEGAILNGARDFLTIVSL